MGGRFILCCRCFVLYPGVTIDLISPWQLRLPLRYREYLMEKGITFHEGEKLEGVIEQADVAYITRVQSERFASKEEYDAVKDVYVVDAEMANRLKPEAIIMHALPRVNEISPDVDGNARAAYFRQAKNGLVYSDGVAEVSAGLRAVLSCQSVCSDGRTFSRRVANGEEMVGARGFEPPTPWSRTRCATRLRYAPNNGLGEWLVFVDKRNSGKRLELPNPLTNLLILAEVGRWKGWWPLVSGEVGVEEC